MTTRTIKSYPEYTSMIRRTLDLIKDHKTVLPYSNSYTGQITTTYIQVPLEDLNRTILENSIYNQYSSGLYTTGSFLWNDPSMQVYTQESDTKEVYVVGVENKKSNLFILQPHHSFWNELFKNIPSGLETTLQYTINQLEQIKQLKQSNQKPNTPKGIVARYLRYL